MSNSDTFMINNDGKKGQSIYDMLSSEFSEKTIDIREIAKHCNDPFFISLLLYKLAEEREKTNKLLAEINEKFDRLILQSKEEKRIEPLEVEKKSIEVLPETDQRILDFVEQRGMVEAEQIMKALNYKGKNAASQRLNKLYREGHLRKVRSGRKVLYLART